MFLFTTPLPLWVFATRQDTQAGIDYVRSPAYAMEMGGMVAQFWKPEASFYELLLYTTAIRISGQDDPSSLGRNEESEFKEFVADNIYILRAEIDQIKVWQPTIQLSEDNWKKNQTVLT